MDTSFARGNHALVTGQQAWQRRVGNSINLGNCSCHVQHSRVNTLDSVVLEMTLISAAVVVLYNIIGSTRLTARCWKWRKYRQLSLSCTTLSGQQARQRGVGKGINLGNCGCPVQHSRVNKPDSAVLEAGLISATGSVVVLYNIIGSTSLTARCWQWR